MRIPILFVSLLVLGFNSCKTKTYSFLENPGTRVSFGEGGGIAGSYEKYSIFENGQVFFQNGFEISNQEEKKSLKKKEIKKALKEINAVNFNSIKYNISGNMYRFIELQDGDSIHKVQWALNDKKINSGIPELYKLLNNLVKKKDD